MLRKIKENKKLKIVEASFIKDKVKRFSDAKVYTDEDFEKNVSQDLNKIRMADK